MVLLVLIRKTLSISAALTVKNLSLILKLNAAMSSTYLTLPVLELPLNSDTLTICKCVGERLQVFHFLTTFLDFMLL